ncbi:MAG: PpiC-type peptidyl-prolyl cis-trans [Desulfobulbaceae bacterium]|nr:MAG: PpiC-type peptidyl-prolyl cis-trans [Desulfobulbaceae bacterium]
MRSLHYLTLCLLMTVLVSISATGLLENSHATVASTQPVAIVNGVEIFPIQLEPMIEEFKSKAKKQEVSAEEKEMLLMNIIRRKLILQQKDVNDLRKDQQISKRVKEFEDELVVKTYLQNKIGINLQVSDEEIAKYYEKNSHEFRSPAKVVARHILLPSQQQAVEVLTKLQKGLDFAEMAKQYSIDLPMAKEGGAMGTIEKGKTLPELDAALFILKEGGISEIVQTPYGFHILTVDKIIPAEISSLEEVKQKIRVIILQQKEALAFTDMVNTLQKGASITIFKERI